MKKYLYILDSNNRITNIAETDLENIDLENHYISEFDEQKVNQVVIGISGVLNGKIVQIGLTQEEINRDIKLNKIATIESLKEQLLQTDYKVTKCYEAFMRQLPLPYNLEEISIQRDAWRAEINQLEQELAAL